MTARRLAAATCLAMVLTGLGTLVVPPSAGAQDDALEDVEPTSIGQTFPTMFADAPDAPSLGELAADGTVPVEGGPGEVSISVDPRVGAQVAGAAGSAFGIASGGAAEPGIADDDVVVYRADSGSRAVRPTGDGGVEFIEEVPQGAPDPVYEFDLPAGTELVLLENGDVAVVRSGATPTADLANAAAALNDAQNEVVAAAVEDYDTALADSTNAHQLESDLEEPVPTAVEELAESADDASNPEESVPDEDGLTDMTTSELAALADELTDDLVPADYAAEDLSLISELEQAVEQAEEVTDLVESSESVAIDAAELDELGLMIDETLVEGINQEILDESTAELDIADPEAELERSAIAVLDAQAEIGSSGRVEAVFSAPMSKTLESGVPVVTSLEVVSDTGVAVVVPDLDETVVVDPFFVPVIAIVVRAVVQRAATAAVRAAAEYAKRQAAAAAARVVAAKQRAQAAQAALKAAARARAEQVKRALEAARIHAARAAQAKKQAAQAIKRQLEQKAAAAKKIAAQAAKKAKDALARAKAQAVKRAKEAAAKAAAKAKNLAARVAKAKQKSVKAKVKRSQSGRASGDTAEQIKKAGEAAVEQVKQFVIRHPVLTDVAAQAATEAIEEAATEVDPCTDLVIETQLIGDGGPLIGRSGLTSLFTTLDLVECVQSAIYGENDPDLTESGVNGGAEAKTSYDGAQVEALRRSRTFAEAPAGTPPGVHVVSVVAPAKVPTGRTSYMAVTARNTGPSVALSMARLHLPEGLPHASGTTDAKNFALTDENADGVWSTGELTTAVMSVKPPVMRPESRSAAISYRLGPVELATASRITVAVDGVSVPSPPTGLAAKPAGSGALTLTWAKVANAATYELELSSGTKRAVAATSYKWTSLANGTSYTFRVRSCDQLGCGSWSAPAPGKPYTVPGTVGKPSISSQNNALKIEYSAPSTGGSSITGYEIGGGVSASTTGRSYTHKTGQSGTARNYRVRACNAAGCGSWSSYSSTLRPKAIVLAKGASAPYGYQYDVKVYGPAGWKPNISCEGPSSGAWWTQTATLNSDGYYRDSTLCYSGYPGGHWVTSGSLKSNTVNW